MQPQRIPVLLLAVTLALLFACAGARPLSSQEQRTRLEQNGYTVLPPPGSGWFVTSRSSEAVIFTKDAGSGARTFLAMAEIRPAQAAYDSPMGYLAAKRQQIEQPESNRYRVLEQDAQLDNRFGDFCVRYRLRAEDLGPEAEGTPEQQATAFARWITEGAPVLDVSGYRCLHPNAPQYEVDVSYSQRGKAEQHDASLAREGDAFLASFQFAPRR